MRPRALLQSILLIGGNVYRGAWRPRHNARRRRLDKAGADSPPIRTRETGKTAATGGICLNATRAAATRTAGSAYPAASPAHVNAGDFISPAAWR